MKKSATHCCNGEHTYSWQFSQNSLQQTRTSPAERGSKKNGWENMCPMYKLELNLCILDQTVSTGSPMSLHNLLLWSQQNTNHKLLWLPHERKNTFCVNTVLGSDNSLSNFHHSHSLKKSVPCLSYNCSDQARKQKETCGTDWRAEKMWGETG